MFFSPFSTALYYLLSRGFKHSFSRYRCAELSWLLSWHFGLCASAYAWGQVHFLCLYPVVRSQQVNVISFWLARKHPAHQYVALMVIPPIKSQSYKCLFQCDDLNVIVNNKNVRKSSKETYIYCPLYIPCKAIVFLLKIVAFDLKRWIFNDRSEF